MKKNNNININSNKINNKILFLSNTSRYLFHYRFLLIKKVSKLFKDLYIFAPIDSKSIILKKYSKFKEWELSHANKYNCINLLKSFFELFNKIKKIKPHIVHAHTLKPNFLLSLVSFILGNNIIISFAGMGRLSKSRGLKSLLLKIILKIIYFSSTHQLNNFLFIKKKYSKVKFIFQNPLDMKYFTNLIKKFHTKNLLYLIPGSGIPEKYFRSTKKYLLDANKVYNFIYCARLEKSKGIELFIDLSDYFPDSKFFIYGDLNINSKDYLGKKEIDYYENTKNNLLFMGYVEDPLLHHHDDESIFIIPSNYGEGLPRGILEALSLGIPTIATKNSCVGLFDEKSLFVIKENNINSYLNAINSIIFKKESGTLDKFLNDGIDYVSQKYKESIIVEKTINLYKSF